MPQPALTLYHMPGACSRVTMNALEEAGLDYADVALDLMKGEQRSAEYQAINPRGKVPTLVVDGTPLSENAAIMLYLDALRPDAGLFPAAADPLARAQVWSDLIWCSATLHPMVRQVRMPIRFSATDPDSVRADGAAKLAVTLPQLEARLARAPWWYGERWSILDVYLFWNYDTADSVIPLDDYPALRAHAGAVRARPSFFRAQAREKAALAAKAIGLPQGATL